jgi:cupin fold WbuC family metalloprotein
MFKLITNDSLAQLSERAKNNPRLRQNLNFHPQNESSCHRLLNALEPGTYVPPHRHLGAEKDETILIVKGRCGVLLFDEQGEVIQQLILDANAGVFGLTIPLNQFHSLLALESGTVFFESKAGPYAALSAEEKASWAPAEGEAGWQDYRDTMLRHFVVK